MKTTLNQIRAQSPCEEVWEKLLRGLGKSAADDEPLWIDEIIDHCGVHYALWCFRAFDSSDREVQLFAIWCARRVQHLLTDPRSIAALDIAERHARGEASSEELRVAQAAARQAVADNELVDKAAARAAAIAAERAAATAEEVLLAARTAEAAAWAAAWAARANIERAAQAEELRRICREMREAKP